MNWEWPASLEASLRPRGGRLFLWSESLDPTDNTKGLGSRADRHMRLRIVIIDHISRDAGSIFNILPVEDIALEQRVILAIRIPLLTRGALSLRG
jgi:hypothetical protein